MSVKSLGQSGQEIKGHDHEVLVCCLKLIGVLSMCLEKGRGTMEVMDGNE